MLADTLMTKNPAKAKDRSPKILCRILEYAKRRTTQYKQRRLGSCTNTLMHVKQGITVDTDYIRELVGFTKDFEADFSETGPFWDKVKMFITMKSTANPRKLC